MRLGYEQRPEAGRASDLYRVAFRGGRIVMRDVMYNGLSNGRGLSVAAATLVSMDELEFMRGRVYGPITRTPGHGTGVYTGSWWRAGWTDCSWMSRTGLRMICCSRCLAHGDRAVGRAVGPCTRPGRRMGVCSTGAEISPEGAPEGNQGGTICAGSTFTGPRRSSSIHACDTAGNRRARVAAANRNLSRPESVRVFRIVPRPLGADDGVMTPTLKIKRRVLAELFADLIEEMYPQGQLEPAH